MPVLSNPHSPVAAAGSARHRTKSIRLGGLGGRGAGGGAARSTIAADAPGLAGVVG